MLKTTVMQFVMLWKILRKESGIIQKHWKEREQRLLDGRTMGKTQARFNRWLRFYVRPRSRYETVPKYTHMCWCAQSWPILCDPMTVANQAPLSMEWSRQEFWSGLPFPSPGNLPDPGMEPESPVSQNTKQKQTKKQTKNTHWTSHLNKDC